MSESLIDLFFKLILNSRENRILKFPESKPHMMFFLKTNNSQK